MISYLPLLNGNDKIFLVSLIQMWKTVKLYTVSYVHVISEYNILTWAYSKNNLLVKSICTFQLIYLFIL